MLHKITHVFYPYSFKNTIADNASSKTNISKIAINTIIYKNQFCAFIFSLPVIPVKTSEIDKEHCKVKTATEQ